MSEYRTEVVIPADRYLCLQLPDHLPQGKGIVTVTVQDEPPRIDTVTTKNSKFPSEDDFDHQDIEWWEEFDDDEALYEPN